MVGFVGAMAAFSIDIVTLYTARSEAQLAADGGALAGARVLANSGMTSMSSTSDTAVGLNAKSIAIAVATQVASNNMVGGRNLNGGAATCTAEICVTVNTGASDFVADPQVTVTVQRTDLPTFFARIWGRTAFTVKASATAEAYNPSSLQGTGGGPGLPIAPLCVKPWLLPNKSPNPGPTSPEIFDPATGAILDTNLLGWVSPPTLRTECSGAGGTTTDCLPLGSNPPTAWRYYPGTTDPATGSFPAPATTSCTGCGAFTDYERSIAGCVPQPISCNSQVNIDTNNYPNRNAETGPAVNNLTHAAAALNSGDSVDTVGTPQAGSEPFQFFAGTDNPVVQSGALSSGATVMISDSLVTVPVIDTSSPAFWPGTYPNNVQIIGFVQLFLNPTGAAAPTSGPTSGHIDTQVINLVGCGDSTGQVTGTTILGNGASAVAVRLVAP